MIFGVTLVAFSYFLYQGLSRNQQTEFDTALYNHAVDVAAAIDFTLLGNLIVQKDVLADGKKVFPFALGQSLIQIRRLDGRVLVTSEKLTNHRLPLSDQDVRVLLGQGANFQTLRQTPWEPTQKERPTEYRLLNYLISKPPFPSLVLQIAAPMSLLHNEREHTLSMLMVSIPLVLLVAAFGGWLISSRALAPVHRIIKTAKEIQASELSVRVPVPEEIELRELALTLNALLSRLEQAFNSQDRFIADASHQLKTPLAILRGELDMIRKYPPTDQEWNQYLDSASQEIDHLSRMVDDLLLLARVDIGSQALSFDRIRVDEVVLEALSRLKYLANEKRIQMCFNIEELEDSTQAMPNFEAKGDYELLRSLVYNLIENAIKYSPEGSQVALTLAETKTHIEVNVKDSGPGISENDLKHVFERFYRVQKDSQEVSGLGLGLSIAHRIAEAHNAQLTVESELGRGSTFRFQIKKI